MFNLIYRKFGNRVQAKDDVLSGLTVALALVPEAVAFAIIAGVTPIIGLYAAFIICLVTAVMGGRPGMISGATGALAVIMVSLVILGNEKGEALGLGPDMGTQYLFATVILMGIIQLGCGVLKLGRFVRLIPQPVMFGFVNGLAIVIFEAQFPMFTESPTTPGSSWLVGNDMYLMLGLVFLTMGIIHFLPKLTTQLPSSLVAIVSISCLVIGLNLDTLVVKDMASIGGALPSLVTFTIPFNWETLQFIAPFAFILAAVGLIESLMTLTLIDELTETRGNSTRECLGQGAANVITGFFGGMGGCAMIGQSMINVNSGGRTRFAAVASALFLLLFILVASPIIEMIPLAALVGVMFMVVIGTFAWRSILILRKVPKTDAFVTILVTAVTVATDLATAVIVGVIVASLSYAWNTAKHIRANSKILKDGQTKIYELEGPLFFGSCEGFAEIFNPEEDPENIIVDFKKSQVVDQSALQSIEMLATKYEALGKNIQLRHLSRDCHALLSKAGHLIIDSDDDPNYALAADYGVKTGIFGSH